VSGAAIGRRLPGSGVLRRRRSAGLKSLAGAGLCARAIVYLVLAYLSADIATRGRPPSQDSGTGALAQVAKEPAGPFLLALLAAGLAAYGLWRFSQALTPPSAHHSGTFPWRRIGWAVAGLVYVGLCAEAVSLLSNGLSASGGASGGGGGGGAASHPSPVVAHVLSWPGGPGWVGLASAVLIGVGVGLGVFAFFRHDDEVLDVGQMSRRVRRTARVSEIAGNLTRGFLVVLVAVYLLEAAVTDDPQRAHSLDSALESVAHSPPGPVVVGLVTAGMVCFALSSLFEARYRKP